MLSNHSVWLQATDCLHFLDFLNATKPWVRIIYSLIQEVLTWVWIPWLPGRGLYIILYAAPAFHIPNLIQHQGADIYIDIVLMNWIEMIIDFWTGTNIQCYFCAEVRNSRHTNIRSLLTCNVYNGRKKKTYWTIAFIQKSKKPDQSYFKKIIW